MKMELTNVHYDIFIIFLIICLSSAGWCLKNSKTLKKHRRRHRVKSRISTPLKAVTTPVRNLTTALSKVLSRISPISSRSPQNETPKPWCKLENGLPPGRYLIVPYNEGVPLMSGGEVKHKTGKQNSTFVNVEERGNFVHVNMDKDESDNLGNSVVTIKEGGDLMHMNETMRYLLK